jgi:nondiscriminating glutamyl-tRNA synthetase
MPASTGTVRVRMAPSPTGPLHIGNARTCLYNYLFARKHDGDFVLRIEDTDATRSTAAYERDMIDNLHWLGLTWDEGPQVAGGEETGRYGPYRQSRRGERYRAAVNALIASGAAYRCYCTPEELEAVRRAQEARREAPRYNRRCLSLTDAQRAAHEAEGRRPAIRFRVEPERIVFDDLIRGRVEFDNALLGDFVIVRADGTPLYNFVVVVDDAAMAITHVIRGEEHVSNTPKQIAIYRALGDAEPTFAHIPLILNADRSKMSKRQGQTAVSEYRAAGYLPEALVNFLAFLGWSPGTEEEIFSLDKLVRRFDLDKVHKGGAIFDRERLDHLNGVYIRSLHDEQLALRLRRWVPDSVDDEGLVSLIPLIRERLVRLSDVVELAAFLWEDDAEVASRYATTALLPKGRDAYAVSEALARARDEVADLGEADFAADVIESRCRAAADELGWKPGDFFRPVRVAVTGRTVSPPLFGSMELLGRERSLRRLDAAIERLTSATPEANRASETGAPAEAARAG